MHRQIYYFDLFFVGAFKRFEFFQTFFRQFFPVVFRDVFQFFYGLVDFSRGDHPSNRLWNNSAHKRQIITVYSNMLEYAEARSYRYLFIVLKFESNSNTSVFTCRPTRNPIPVSLRISRISSSLERTKTIIRLMPRRLDSKHLKRYSQKLCVCYQLARYLLDTFFFFRHSVGLTANIILNTCIGCL